MDNLYSGVEADIVAHLSPLASGGAIDVVQLPQVQSEQVKPFVNARVTVAYLKSDFGDIRSTFEISQDEILSIEVVIVASTLRGQLGLHRVTESVKRRLVGFRPTNCSKMWLASHTYKEHDPKEALWVYSMTFKTTYLIVEDKEYNTENPLTQVSFQYNDEIPSLPPIPFPGTVPNPPIIAYKGDIAYWDGEVWRRLHPGTSGYVLATRGQGEVPEWVEQTGGSGSQGPQGPQGEQGVPGQDGQDGQDGADGLSAYQIALNNGFEGTEAEWLESLRGADGQDGRDGIDGTNGQDGADGANGADGTDGKSAYEIAVENGFVGTESQWLLSLKGETGSQGPQGATGATGATGPGVASGGTAGQILVKNSSTDFDTEWQSIGLILARQILAKTGDQTTTSLTAVAVTGLESTSLSAGKYAIKGSIGVASSSTAGMKIGISIPTGATMRVKGLDRGTTNNNSVTEILNTSGTLSTVNFCQINGNSIVNIEGTITIGATAGVVSFIFAKTTSGTATISDEGTQITIEKI